MGPGDGPPTESVPRQSRCSAEFATLDALSATFRNRFLQPVT